MFSFFCIYVGNRIDDNASMTESPIFCTVSFMSLLTETRLVLLNSSDRSKETLFWWYVVAKGVKLILDDNKVECGLCSNCASREIFACPPNQLNLTRINPSGQGVQRVGCLISSHLEHLSYNPDLVFSNKASLYSEFPSFIP